MNISLYLIHPQQLIPIKLHDDLMQLGILTKDKWKKVTMFANTNATTDIQSSNS